MWKLLGIALGAGVTSAALLAVVTTATPAAMLLVALSPLPIMIAGLGFAHPVAGAAALVGGGALGAALGLPWAVLFLVALGLPAWHLSRLAQARRASANAAPDAGWYPIPSLLLNLAAAAALPVLLAGAALVWRFGSYGTLVDWVGAQSDAWTGEAMAGAVPVALAVRLAPVAGVALGTAVLAVNLWLAARSVQISDLLRRPWPNLPDALRLPRPAAVALIALAGLGLLPAPWGPAASVPAAALGVVFAFEGLAAAHVLTRGLSGRGLVLAAIYVATLLLLPWPLLALALLGCIDCLAPGLRRGAGIRIIKLPRRRD